MDKQSCILVTGAGGVLGTALLSVLREAGYENVLAPTHNELDLLDRNQVLDFFGKEKPDYVFHLASIVYGLRGNDVNQWKSLILNTEINHNIFMAIETFGVKKIFFASTVAAYPDGTPIPLREENFFIGLPHSGEFGYAMSKRHAYAYLELLKEKRGISFCYGTFTNIFGKNDRFNSETGHVIPSLIQKAYVASNDAHDLEVWGNSNTTRDFIYADDAASGAICAMERLDGIVNISTGEEVSMGQVAQAVASCFPGLKYVWNSSMPVGISKRWVCNDKLKSIGWKPEHNFEDAVLETVEWYKENVHLVRK